MASQENADEEAKLARHNAGLESGDRRLMVKVGAEPHLTSTLNAIVFMDLPGQTPSGNAVLNDVDINYGSGDDKICITLTTGLVVYDAEWNAFQVLFGEAITPTGFNADGEESTREKFLIRVFPATKQQSKTRTTLSCLYTSTQTKVASEIKYYQISGDNQPPGKGLQDFMKSGKFRESLPRFPGTLDPQVALQRLRTFTAEGNEPEHKKSWIAMNTEAMVKTFVTDRYPRQGQNMKIKEALKLQIARVTDLYYEHVVCNNPVPEDLEKVELKFFSAIPTRLVRRLGMQADVRSNPGTGGRNEALARKQANRDSKVARGGKEKRVRLPAKPDDVEDSDHHRLHGKTNVDGSHSQKRGRKKNSRVSSDGTVLAPVGSSKPIANKAVAASASDKGSSSSATAAFVSHRVLELEQSVEDLIADKARLEDSIRDMTSAAAKKDGEYQAELRNRSNIAMLTAQSTGPSDPDNIKSYVTNISPFKVPAPRMSGDSSDI